MMMAQQQQFGAQGAFAQQITNQSLGGPGVMGSIMNMGVGGPTPGMAGEHLAAGAASFGGNVVWPAASGAAGLMGGMGMLGAAGTLLDPFSTIFRAGSMGFSAAGVTGALGGAAVAALPYYAMGKAIDAYGGAFMGGIQQQAATNSTLRQNFQFHGGQGFMGRGFGQQQMGQIGGVMQQELQRNLMTSPQELNSLITGGAQAGMFQGVRDVQDFSRKFREMISTLKSITKELGGTMQEALQFVNAAKGAGIFSSADRARFAAGVRETSAVTGMSTAQVLAVSQQGAQITRAIGGVGRQGAMGAQLALRQVGGALQRGFINEEMLSEATGGLTGEDAIAQFSMNMMTKNARFARSRRGRFQTFALSNDEGTGVDMGAVTQFLGGDMSVRDITRGARQNVRSMGGIAAARNREGMLRGDMVEHLGAMGANALQFQSLLGDRIFDMSDERMQHILRRRGGLGQNEARIASAMARNAPQIIEESMQGAQLSRRQASYQQDITENRSIDAFMRHLSHGMSEGTGVTRVREMGRNFMTKFSSAFETQMNQLLGVADMSMSQGSREAINRITRGRGTTEDIGRISAIMGAGGRQQTDIFARGMLQTSMSVGDALQARGYNVSSRTSNQSVQSMLELESLASQGIVRGADASSLQRALGSGADGLQSRMQNQIAYARALGNETSAFDLFRNENGMNSRVSQAFMARRGMGGFGDINASNMGGGLGRGEESGLLGGIRRGATAGAQALAPIALPSMGMSLVAGGIIGGITGGIESLINGPQSARDRSINALTSGGASGARIRNRLAALGRREGGSGADSDPQAARQLAILTGGGGQSFGREDMAAVVNDRDVSQALIGLRSEDESVRRAAMSRLEGLGGQMSERHQNALASLRMNVDMQTQGGKRRVSANVIQAIGASGENQAIIRELNEFGRGVFRASMAEGISDATRTELMGIRGAVERTTAGVGNAQDVASINTGMQDTIRRLSTLPTNERNAEIQALSESGGDIGQQIAMGTAGRRRLGRQLGVEGYGRARGGSRTARATAASMLFGDVSGMEFQIGGRTVRGNDRSIRTLMRGGGSESQRDDMLTSLVGQLQEQGGLTRRQAEDQVATFRSVFNAGAGGDGGSRVTSREMDRLENAANIPAISRMRQEQERQRTERQQPPWEREKLSRLQTIADNTSRMIEAIQGINPSGETGAPNTSEPDGSSTHH